MYSNKLTQLLAYYGGTNYFVDGSKSNDTGDGLSWATAKKTIQATLNLAGASPSYGGERVWVRGGRTYTENLHVTASTILIGIGDPSSWASMPLLKPASGTQHVGMAEAQQAVCNFAMQPGALPGVRAFDFATSPGNKRLLNLKIEGYDLGVDVGVDATKDISLADLISGCYFRNNRMGIKYAVGKYSDLIISENVFQDNEADISIVDGGGNLPITQAVCKHNQFIPQENGSQPTAGNIVEAYPGMQFMENYWSAYVISNYDANGDGFLDGGPLPPGLNSPDPFPLASQAMLHSRFGHLRLPFIGRK